MKSKIIKLLIKKYPKPATKITKRNPFQTYIKTVLSAQCTDEIVERVSNNLFKEYKTPQDFVKIKQEKLEQLIKSTGFYKNKTKNIKKGAKLILKEYNNKIPYTMSKLLKLPGVARKTANVILQNSFNKTIGIVVDTHVIRISQRLGITTSKNPKKIEEDLMKYFPKDDWKLIPQLFKSLGRDVCKGSKPKCDKCILKEICPKIINP